MRGPILSASCPLLSGASSLPSFTERNETKYNYAKYQAKYATKYKTTQPIATAHRSHEIIYYNKRNKRQASHHTAPNISSSRKKSKYLSMGFSPLLNMDPGNSSRHSSSV